MAAAVLLVLVLVGGALVRTFSDAAATRSVTSEAPETAPAAPDDVPEALTEAWRAPSAATPVPLAVGPTAITADGSEVVGRDPLTGLPRWSYRRELQLCTVGAAWNRAVAVYEEGEYCGEVTTLEAAGGARGPQRNADVGLGARLQGNGTLVAATSPYYLEVWRSDLVRTVEYGEVPVEVQPGRQPRPGCRHASVVLGTGRLGVLERCPDDPGDRLTMLEPNGEEADSPEELFSVVLPEKGARLVALSPDRAAVLLPDPTRLAVLDADGEQVASYPLDLPAGDLDGDPAGGVVPTTYGVRTIQWWTGSRTIGLDISTLRPVWSLPNTLGPGTLMAGRLVVPVPDGLAVLDSGTGDHLLTVHVPRGDHSGRVGLASLGPVLLEQRGPEVVALVPANAG